MIDGALTKAEIFAAANVIAKCGKIPAILTVRKELGNRGSETTLGKHLREWKKDLLQRGMSGCVFCDSLELQNKTLQVLVKTLSEEVVMFADECQNLETKIEAYKKLTLNMREEEAESLLCGDWVTAKNEQLQ